MIQMQFRSVSASEAGDYFQVLFEQEEDNLEAGYFLIQRQFEFPDEHEFYIESDDGRFCGSFEIETATLNRGWLCLEVPSTEWKSLRIQFNATQVVYQEVERILKTMFQEKLLHVTRDS